LRAVIVPNTAILKTVLHGESGRSRLFDQVLQKLRAAWHLLRDAEVRRFVFTSDHGFLLYDEADASVQAHGRTVRKEKQWCYVRGDERQEALC